MRLASTAILLSCLASPALAAEAPDAGAASEDASTSDGNEILVTAQRRAERIQDVPITVSTLSAATLDQAGASSLRDVATLTPAVRFDVRGTEYQPTIRGVGTALNLPGGGSNVGIYVDGFYISNPNATDFQLLNVENVQVLKGPQGTLFGRNTTGGAILVTTSKPSTETRGVMDLAYGSFNELRLQGYVTTGLSDRIAVEIGGLYARGDSFVTNVFTNDNKVGAFENWSIRAGIRAQVTDDFSLMFRYSRQSWDDPRPLLTQPYERDGVVYATAFYRPGHIQPSAPRQISNDIQTRFEQTSNTYQLTGELDLSGATIRSYTQFYNDYRPILQYSVDYSNLKILDQITRFKTQALSQELILSSKGGSRLNYTVGAFYFHNKQELVAVELSSAGAPFAFAANSGATVQSIALFGDVTYEVVDNLFVTGGIRYNNDKHLNGFFRNNSGTSYFPELSNDSLTPRAVVRYAINNSSSVYASFTKGYKAPLFNIGGNAAANFVPIRSEQISAYEVGFKSSTRKLQFSVSGYYYDYKNLQLNSFALINNTPTVRIDNAASSKIYGIDAEVQYWVTPSFKVFGAVGWTHARFDQFPTAPRFVETATHTLAQIQGDASGYHMARAPEFTGNAGAVYSFEAMGGKVELSANVYYSSMFYFDVSQQLPQNSYALVNLGARWTDPSGKWTLGVTGSNVTNAGYYTQASQGTYGVGAAYGAPATVEGSVRFRF
jgi:iron complex outermembrane receptor protein